MVEWPEHGDERHRFAVMHDPSGNREYEHPDFREPCREIQESELKSTDVILKIVYEQTMMTNRLHRAHPDYVKPAEPETPEHLPTAAEEIAVQPAKETIAEVPGAAVEPVAEPEPCPHTAKAYASGRLKWNSCGAYLTDAPTSKGAKFSDLDAGRGFTGRRAG